MLRIAALGPSDTFSERIAREYAARVEEGASVVLYPTIRRTFMAVGDGCDHAILPIENMIDGYVQPVLDLLLHSDLSIVDELILPIQFVFVANSAPIGKVKRIYAQFVTQGQCAEFLESVSHAEIVTTQSNGASLEQVRRGGADEGAIIPSFVADQEAFPLVVRDVSDYPNNRTRFIAVARDGAEYDEAKPQKTSLVVIEGMDRPGMLAEILGAFSKRKVNLVSIMSRPTKESLGKYHFFIDIEGHGLAPHIEDALAEIQRHNFVRLLGSYPRAQDD